ncbi:hypothetical protein PACTADRAFT_51260 [Pachysolen tannophilus NRRL Y-2460]|uniref:Pre-mRNA-splicing factor SLU7 n=1 Tax=Pachysolen tannophilus NRRL Y-2460 TaxID=669874 RepID=A0A1E4TRS3_PACTA|nr:hypothetical protein PACTADRAFT_51260 [Pachysolen tannophilus NRRL Y-2460]
MSYNKPTRTRREIKYDANGKSINPYIPKYISRAPWYSDSQKINGSDEQVEDNRKEDYLSHQRLDPSKPVVSNAEPTHGSGIVDAFVDDNKRKAEEEEEETSRFKKVKFFPKNACSNCGSLNHKRKDCLEKPRKNGARYIKKNDFNGEGEVREEDRVRYIRNVEGWDEKRDRWYGYNDWDEQDKIWHELESIRRDKIAKAGAKAEAKASAKAEAKADTKVNNELEMDEEEALEMAELGLLTSERDLKVQELVQEDLTSKMHPAEEEKLSVRSREDKPSYLSNINDGNITYNPKTRTDRSKKIGYIDEFNQFVRYRSGEAQELERLKKFAWDLNRDNKLKERTARREAAIAKKEAAAAAAAETAETAEAEAEAGVVTAATDASSEKEADVASAAEAAAAAPVAPSKRESPSKKEVPSVGHSNISTSNLKHLNNHPEASPTAVLLAIKKKQQEAKALKDAKRNELLAKYGVLETDSSETKEEVSVLPSDHQPVSSSSSAELPTIKTDSTYIEYTSDGKIKSKIDKAAYDFQDIYNPKRISKTSSKYNEDIYPGNHNSVWGSFYDPKTAKWGYICCKQLYKNSYCSQDI